MQKFLCPAIALALALAVPLAAEADSADNAATHLLPLEARDLEADVDPDRLQTVAAQINQATFGEKEPQENVLDVGNMPWLESFIDENGEAKLPLGLTVFSTLGDPSVGFGGSF